MAGHSSIFAKETPTRVTKSWKWQKQLYNNNQRSTVTECAWNILEDAGATLAPEVTPSTSSLC